ncbi:hypothetical protein MUP00_08460, partial [Candidatus Bathyarchaeota archaeon]|nr:hypothetical protein [Candidatus Bathyarchaeota archaeon]
VAGGNHRQFRHDIHTIEQAIQVFGSKYNGNEELIRNIVLDHIIADATGRNRRKQEEAQPQTRLEQENDTTMETEKRAEPNRLTEPIEYRTQGYEPPFDALGSLKKMSNELNEMIGMVAHMHRRLDEKEAAKAEMKRAS